ncbi:hypothetical protein T03_1229 [Trichinella britovi]|uniref:Uncharacterized protein n=1 Tax=Trichinella britovi TaxID=45882 RepID=A0A0V1C4U2_TRIBR|nr:hypothetical protein T03_1229 [Trichinella britovi]
MGYLLFMQCTVTVRSTMKENSEKVAGETAECSVLVAYSLLLWALLLVYFIPKAPPDELSSLEEEKLLRNDNSPNDVSSSHLRRIRYSQFNSVSVVFRAVND